MDGLLDGTGGLVGLAGSAFLAATALPGGTEAVMAALLIGSDHPAWLVVAVASLFNTLGSVLSFYLGWFIERWRGSRLMPVSPETLERARAWFARYGAWALLMSWVPFVGDAFPVAAGFLRLSPWIAFPLIAIGKTARFVAVAWGIGAGERALG